jgi:hypothetical protein
LWWTCYGSVCQTTERNAYRYDCTNTYDHYTIHYDRNTLSNIYALSDAGWPHRYADSVRHKATNQHAFANGIAYRNSNTNIYTNVYTHIYTNVYANTECHTIGDAAAYEHANSIPDTYTEFHADGDSLSNANMDSDNYTDSSPYDYFNPAPNRNPLIDQLEQR